MPLYFFHVGSSTTAMDREGLDYPDIAAAREEALEALREIIADEVKSGSVPKYENIAISDEAGECVATVTFNDAIEIKEQRST
jgi:hypothetical protein